MFQDWLHCLHRRRFKTIFQICKKGRWRIKRYSCNPKTFSGDNSSFKTEELRDVSPQRGGDTRRRMCHKKKRSDTQRKYTHSKCKTRIHKLCCRMWIKHEINILLQKLALVTKKKNVKTKLIQSSSPTTMQTKQNNLQISRNRGRWLVKFIENLNKMQSTEFTSLRRKNEFWQTTSTPSSWTGLC